MDFDANDYYRAALERMRQARLLCQSGDSFAMAMYVAGLAVECKLRAFRWRKDATFDGRHDLLRLFKESGILRLDEELLESKGVDPIQLRTTVVAFRAAMNTVVLLWANDYRFTQWKQSWWAREGRHLAPRRWPEQRRAAAPSRCPDVSSGRPGTQACRPRGSV